MTVGAVAKKTSREISEDTVIVQIKNNGDLVQDGSSSGVRRRGWTNKSALHIKWPKGWSFSFSISPSNEYSSLISFRIV